MISETPFGSSRKLGASGRQSDDCQWGQRLVQAPVNDYGIRLRSSDDGIAVTGEAVAALHRWRRVVLRLQRLRFLRRTWASLGHRLALFARIQEARALRR